MNKTDPTVKRETAFIGSITLILSLFMQGVFLVLRQWDVTVLFGNLLGGAVAVLNFFLMGISVQKAVAKEEKDAANTMKLSQGLRMLMLFAAAALGALLPVFNTAAVLIPLFFPRIAVFIRTFLIKKEKREGKADE